MGPSTKAEAMGSDPSSSWLVEGRRVIEIEAAALQALAGALDESFVKAAQLMIEVKGRVIVAGMGKSGHVGRKIAATLASTGTPAHFVHPAEASHGDLGMITRSDLALVLSNSGETAELSPLIEHTRRFGVPLIGVASRAESVLLRQSDVALLLPKADEACPLGLAPTSSTTMTLSLGDALAIALMRARGFGEEDFRAFHPGGALGARLLSVSDLMHQGEDLPLVSEATSMSDAIMEMTAKTFGVAGVVDPQGRLIGVITDGDLRRCLRGGVLSDLGSTRAGAIATRKPKTIVSSALAAEALGRMNELKVTSLFVVEAERPIGLIRVHDCLRAGVR